MSVDEHSGIIKTINKFGRAHVSIISREDFDIVQSLVIPVEVNIFNFSF